MGTYRSGTVQIDTSLEGRQTGGSSGGVIKTNKVTIDLGKLPNAGYLYFTDEELTSVIKDSGILSIQEVTYFGDSGHLVKSFKGKGTYSFSPVGGLVGKHTGLSYKVVSSTGEIWYATIEMEYEYLATLLSDTVHKGMIAGAALSWSNTWK